MEKVQRSFYFCILIITFCIFSIKELKYLGSAIGPSGKIVKKKCLANSDSLEKDDKMINSNTHGANSITEHQQQKRDQDAETAVSLVHGNQETQKKFISFKILRNFPFNFGYGDLDMKTLPACASIRKRKTFQAGKQPGVLDFNTQIRTNLNILYVGSSVGVQFAQGFEEASAPVARQVIRYAYNWFQENTFSSLTPDNGTISGLRITGLFLKKAKDKKMFLSPTGGGGWLSYDVRELKRLAHQWRVIKPINTAFGKPTSPCEVNGDKNIKASALLNEIDDYPCEQKNFDVVVYQPAIEWVYKKKYSDEALSLEKLREAVELSFDYLGASTVILQTIPIQNNIRDINELVALNTRIWKYAREFQANMDVSIESIENSTTIKNGKLAPLPVYRRKILVMDLYSLSVASYVQNSMEIGILSNETGKDLQSKLLSKSSIDNPFHFLNLTMALNESIQNFTIPHRKYFTHGMITHTGHRNNKEILYRKIGHSCGDKSCTIRSNITNDGIHWCMDQFAGRLNAGLACLLQCSYDDGELQQRTMDSKTMIDCERSCNAQYMSLDPVRWENGQETVINDTTFIGLNNYRKEKL